MYVHFPTEHKTCQKTYYRDEVEADFFSGGVELVMVTVCLSGMFHQESSFVALSRKFQKQRRLRASRSPRWRAQLIPIGAHSADGLTCISHRKSVVCILGQSLLFIMLFGFISLKKKKAI